MREPLYVIWSEEHGAWWGPERMGYTRSLNAAGRYNQQQVIEIVAEANRYTKELMEVGIEDPIKAIALGKNSQVIA